MLLKLKSLIYRLTGIYLADKEELDYIKSKEFWKQFRKIVTHKKNDLSLEVAQGLLIGLWQTKHRFYRKMKRIRK